MMCAMTRPRVPTEWNGRCPEGLTGIGIWLAARRLHQGKFVWPAPGDEQWQLESDQLQALVLGLPWQRMGSAGIITVV